MTITFKNIKYIYSFFVSDSHINERCNQIINLNESWKSLFDLMLGKVFIIVIYLCENSVYSQIQHF